MTVTGSTNDDALAAARAGAPHGATFVADAQTRGRGRRGRTWFAESGESLLCSVVLRLDLALDQVPALALAGGLALRHAIAKHLATERPEACVAVKWPNDVWVDEKKIAGILCESQIQSGSSVAVIFGFGVNLMAEVFPDALSLTATSFARLGVSCAREALLADALAELDARGALLSEGGVGALSRELSDHDALLGQTVRVDGLEGTAVGVSERGELLLRQKTGETARLTSGTVELVREEDYSGK